MFSESQDRGLRPYCLWCFSTEKLNRCSRCASAFYCCKDHQVQHWKSHRQNCLPQLKEVQQDKNCVIQNHTKTMSNLQTQYSENVQSEFIPSIHSQFTQDISTQFSPSVQNQAFTSWPSNSTDKSISQSSSNIFPSEQLSLNSYTNDCFPPPQIDQTASFFETDEIINLDNIFAANSSKLDEKLFSENDLFSTLTTELLSSTNNYWDIINNYNNFDDFDLNCDFSPSSPKQCEKVVENNDLNFIQASFSPETGKSSNENPKPEKILLLEDVCQNIVHDLNHYGICVIDDFLGSKAGNSILTEVKCMFLKGLFKRGELISLGTLHPNETIRGDVITWVDGTENYCHYVGYLIKKLDLVMTACNKMPDNGILSSYKLNKRTKAMIACYPGDGTYYKKHIDNPNNDGRCITCIYYLNKNWDIKTQGGLLRMFPVGHENEVANIEPIFDRMLFFWSDKRNPHEVLSSFAVRFAITVWYFDSDEREKALEKRQLHEYT